MRIDIEQVLVCLVEVQGNSDQVVGDLEVLEVFYECLIGNELGKLGWLGIFKVIKLVGLEDVIMVVYQNNLLICVVMVDVRVVWFVVCVVVGDMLLCVDLESGWSNGFKGNFGNWDQEDFCVGVWVIVFFFIGGCNIVLVKCFKYMVEQEEFEFDDIQ